MLIIALVLAVIGLVSLVTAVVTSNEFVAWVCIGASAVGVILLIVDAIREHQHETDPVEGAAPDSDAAPDSVADDDLVVESDDADSAVEYPEDEPAEAVEPAADTEPAEGTEIREIDNGEIDNGEFESGDEQAVAGDNEPDQADLEGVDADSDQPEQEPEASIDQTTARWLSSS